MINQQIQPGIPYGVSLVYKNDDGTLFDFTGYKAKMQFRRNYGNSGVPLYESNTENGDIVIDNSTATVSVLISKDTTKLFNAPVVYELVAYNDTNTIPLINGTDTLLPGVVIL